MAKKEHRFNPQTLTYEVITAPFRLRTYRLLRKILIGFILISVANVLFSISSIRRRCTASTVRTASW